MSPEEAHQIDMELVQEFLDGEYDFVLFFLPLPPKFIPGYWALPSDHLEHKTHYITPRCAPNTITVDQLDEICL